MSAVAYYEIVSKATLTFAPLLQELIYVSHQKKRMEYNLKSIIFCDYMFPIIVIMRSVYHAYEPFLTLTLRAFLLLGTRESNNAKIDKRTF